MQVIDSLESFRQQYKYCVATIGKYDGMHLGHQLILQRLKEEARIHDLPSVVILSEPQPEEFFAENSFGKPAPVRLNHFLDKVDFLRDFGIDVVYRMTFDHDLSQYSPERFIKEVLIDGLGVKSLVVGDDFRFGKNRQGDFSFLEKAAQQGNFSVHAESACCLGESRISSTEVRKYLLAGDCEKVRSLLGRNYSISGEVIKGKQLGRELGTPTANVKLESVSLPILGVYAVRALVRGQEFKGVANIGFRPTVDEQLTPSLEVFMFDFNDDIYGATLKVFFLKKIRDEKKFSSLEELKKQISIDVSLVRDFFKIETESPNKRVVDVK